ncbi:MAG: flippase [Dehalococcoidia bacterium]|nr:flippase [Dehalococcoidia bacterium]
MSQVRRIARNTALLILGDVIVYAFGFVFTIYVARYLEAEGYGVLSFAIGFTAMFSILADLGMQTLISREVARDRTLARKYIANVTSLKLVLNTIVFGLIALIVNLLDYSSETVFVVYLLALSLIFTSLNGMFNGVFRGNERMEFITLGQAVTGAVSLGGALLVIHCGFGIIGIALVYAAGTLASLSCSLIVSSIGFVKPRIEFDPAFLKAALAQSWPFALASFLFTMYYWTDTVVLSFMKGDEAVGWYNAAYRLVFVLSFIPMAYFNAIFPLMSRLHLTSRDLLRFAYERSFKYMLLLAVPIAAGTTLLADRIIAQIFGSGFSESVLALRILVWALVLQFPGSAFVQLFNSTNRQRTTTLVVGITAICNLILDLVLTPIYGLNGTAAATLGNVAVLIVLGYIFSASMGYRLPDRMVLFTLLRVLLASAAMAFLVMYFDSLSMYALIPLGAAIYFLVLCLVGGFDKQDVNLVRQLVQRDGVSASRGNDE